MAQERTRPGLLPAVGALAGALLGLLGARVVLVGSGLSLIPWTVGGLVLGACCRALSAALATGATYGFALAFTFMTTGYDGAAPLHTRLLPFATLGLVGAACGATLAAVGHALGQRVRRRRRAS